MKEKSEVKVEGKPVFYAVLYNSIKKAALECGYALAMHGSMHSDMDLIAVAWVEDAKQVEDLVKAIDNCLGNTVWKEYNFKNCEARAHGRIVYTLSISGDWFIDLSIIAPVEQLKLNGVGVRSEQLPCKNEYAKEIIEDALYKTGRFSTDDCTEIMEGLMMQINDANLHFTEQGN